jgi:phosphatidylinositol glycan class K
MDYRGSDITIPYYYNLLRGKFPAGTSARRSLPFGGNRNLLIFHTGHGGNGYLKMGEAEAMLDWVLRYVEIKANKILVLTDSCMAITLWEKLEPSLAQNLISIASSQFN